MLPIFRIVSVGGVLLAIFILALALNAPGDSRTSMRVVHVLAPARGPLIDRNEHPEWRQLLILAALKRADEIKRLRDLPDAPVRIAPPAPVVEEIVPAPTLVPEKSEAKAPPQASAPVADPPPPPALTKKTTQSDSEKVAALPLDPKPKPGADDVTGALGNADSEAGDSSIPIDIGETSSTELPVLPHEEEPPVNKIGASGDHQSMLVVMPPKRPPIPATRPRAVAAQPRRVAPVRPRPVATRAAPSPSFFDLNEALFSRDNSSSPVD
jgi:hypothetical protein